MVAGPLIIGGALAIDQIATAQLVKELTGTARARFPKLNPGELLRAAVEIEQLQERGLQPASITDPFTGDLIIGTADQDLGLLAQEAAVRRFSRPSESDLRVFGRAVEEVRRAPLAAAQAVLPESQKSSVTARPVPGGVARGTGPPRIGSGALRRLGGPCAGATSSIDRIRCNVGGIT